jgi:hypothetical protein
MWGPAYSLFVVVLLGFFSVRTAVGAWQLDGLAVMVFGGLAAGLLLFCRGLFAGLMDAILVPVRNMDVTLEENAVGILFGNERWYLFLDCVIELRKYRDDVWTVRHSNGTVLHISAAAISDDQLDCIRAAMEHGRTPEGVMAVVERGRRIREIMDRDSEA